MPEIVSLSPVHFVIPARFLWQSTSKRKTATQMQRKMRRSECSLGCKALYSSAFFICFLLSSFFFSTLFFFLITFFFFVHSSFFQFSLLCFSFLYFLSVSSILLGDGSLRGWVRSRSDKVLIFACHGLSLVQAESQRAVWKLNV